MSKPTYLLCRFLYAISRDNLLYCTLLPHRLTRKTASETLRLEEPTWSNYISVFKYFNSDMTIV